MCEFKYYICDIEKKKKKKVNYWLNNKKTIKILKLIISTGNFME